MLRVPHRVFSRSELVDACLPEGNALERTVDSHVSNLRRKLDRAGMPGLCALVVRGVGYRQHHDRRLARLARRPSPWPIARQLATALVVIVITNCVLIFVAMTIWTSNEEQRIREVPRRPTRPRRAGGSSAISTGSTGSSKGSTS